MKLIENKIKNTMNEGEQYFLKNTKTFKGKEVTKILFEPYTLEIMPPYNENWKGFVYKPDFFVWVKGEKHPYIIELKGYNPQKEDFELAKENSCVQFTIQEYGEMRFNKMVWEKKEDTIQIQDWFEWRQDKKEHRKSQQSVITEMWDSVKFLMSVKDPVITKDFWPEVDFITSNYSYISSFRKKSKRLELKKNISKIIDDLRYIEINKTNKERWLKRWDLLNSKLQKMI